MTESRSPEPCQENPSRHSIWASLARRKRRDSNVDVRSGFDHHLLLDGDLIQVPSFAFLRDRCAACDIFELGLLWWLALWSHAVRCFLYGAEQLAQLCSTRPAVRQCLCHVLQALGLPQSGRVACSVHAKLMYCAALLLNHSSVLSGLNWRILVQSSLHAALQSRDIIASDSFFEAPRSALGCSWVDTVV